MFFTNGQNQREYADTKIAMDIGYYWTNVVTKGKGYYNNCNMNTYKHNGIGRILYNDKTRIKNLKENVAPYFCKGEQNITTPDGKCIRALRRGLMPRKTNKGRPRKYNKNIN
ncbi:hypothetical protein [Campylobacter showae]|uniref:Uncharacterized protein n=1 Tax=Campylobacter showae CC57C TaxID=1073353 RepID=M3JCI5_9BACT|nr:hypothetical protein [Campylobacter showae]EMG31018.1 hypothetical protein H740_03437 [Campylobacter showae CC57C]